MLVYQTNLGVYVFAYAYDTPIQPLLDQLQTAGMGYTYSKDIAPTPDYIDHYVAVYNQQAATLLKLQSGTMDVDWHTCLDFLTSLGCMQKVTLKGYINGGWRTGWEIEDKAYPEDMLEWFIQNEIKVTDVFEGQNHVYTPDDTTESTSHCISVLYDGNMSESTKEDFYFNDDATAEAFRAKFA